MVLVKTRSYWGDVGALEDFAERWPGSGFKRVSARGWWESMIVGAFLPWSDARVWQVVLK